MAWKYITGRSFADSMIVPHAAIKELDDLNDLIDIYTHHDFRNPNVVSIL